jgi:hypothetical protein
MACSPEAIDRTIQFPTRTTASQGMHLDVRQKEPGTKDEGWRYGLSFVGGHYLIQPAPRILAAGYGEKVMKANVGYVDRIIRAIVGIALIAATLTGSIGLWG